VVAVEVADHDVGHAGRVDAGGAQVLHHPPGRGARRLRPVAGVEHHQVPARVDHRRGADVEVGVGGRKLSASTRCTSSSGAFSTKPSSGMVRKPSCTVVTVKEPTLNR
jgi:hypothetical protein